MPVRSAASGTARGRLSPEAVIDRAMVLADAEGLDAVTVRKLADLLGVTPMALYWHFRDKRSLLSALADRVTVEIDLAVDVDAPWLDQLRHVMTSMVRVLRAHPWAARLFSGWFEPSGPQLRGLEVVLGILARGGLTPQRAVGITRHVLRTVVGMVADEPAYQAPAEPACDPGSEAMFAELPAGEFPHVLAAVAPLTACDDADEYYAFGMELLFAGVEAITSGITPAGTPPR